MSNDPFVILGISRGATQSEILDAYKQKREFYQAHIFDEGEDGADAARMLEQLDIAYQDAMTYCHEQATVTGDSASFEDVKAAISAKDMARAQALLDEITYRGGEWHYYQAIIFYEKNWFNECKKQLEIAIEIDGGNEKYVRALEKLKKKTDGEAAFRQTAQENSNVYGNPNAQAYETQRTYQQQRQPDAADGCCAACQALWCMDCCCECMGGDLIRCC